MRNIMNSIFNTFLNSERLLKYPFQRPSWSSNVRIVEWYKIFIASIWVLYLALEIEQFKRFALPIYKFLSNYNFLKAIISNLYENRVILLLALTIPAILDIIFKKVSYKKLSYKKLNPELFPEYDLDDYSFQTHLVEFLNSSDSIHNVFWLDGSWGSGKTFFIKTFFENQIYKKKEIYYISCFGIKTREQAEKILINEIEKQSILGNLDFIPLVGGVFKWFFKTVGTDLMKRDSIIIFDDFERVSYTETSDNPSDYNDLLGYIDYLSENKRFKIIVILNSEEIKSTKKNLIDNKFKLNHNRMVSTEEVIDNILKKSKFKDSNLGEILSLIYKIYYGNIDERVVEDKNKDSKVKKPSLREFQKSLEELLNIIESGRLLPYSGRKKSNYVDYIAVYIVDCMNGRMGTDSILVSFFEFFDGIYEIDEYDQSYELDAYFHFEMLEKIVGLSSLDSLPTSEEDIYFYFNYIRGPMYYFQLLSCLWEVGLRNLFISKTGHKVYYDAHDILCGRTKGCLVEIYYDILNDRIKNNYQVINIDELKDAKCQNFIKKCLPLESKGQITINHIPLDELVLSDS